MLEDRYYMRQSPFAPRRSVTVALVVINAAVFLAQAGLARFSTFPTSQYFALSMEGLQHGYLWQLLSYQFMHGGLLHLLFNCWAIYVFGLDVEAAVGRARFVTLYLASGVIGGLVQLVAGQLLGGPFAASVVGASAAAFGVVAVFALLFPERVIYLFFILPLRAKHLLWLCGGLAVLGMVVPQQPATDGTSIAHAAHLGGMLTGLFFGRYAVHWSWRWPRLRRLRPQPPRRLVKVRTGATGLWDRSKTVPEEDLSPDEFLSKEVDPILDKISAQGMDSLTERERRILDAAVHKIVKR